MNISASTIVITGGAQGLGRAMAEHFAAAGAKLALIDMNAETLAEACELCTAKGAMQAQGYVVNVTDEAAVEQVFEQIVADFGELNVLINNAGILRDGMLVKCKDGEITHKMPLQQFQSVLDVNLTGSFLCGREAAAHMAKAGNGGVIINISSVARSGNIGQTNYAATKAGVVAMTVTWARELGRFGIRCGAIAPGFIETPMTAQMKPEAIERALSMVPLRRWGQPDEIAHSARYIIENDFFSGRVIEIDGGVRL
ncbi:MULTISPECIES: SDR family oxidoreductase [Pseudidiomarina]|uniref:3-oxoacyl-[acyl-carrier protein] reductase n=4 Tax=Pseudidiomarina TaxID=2800384 RepID=A0A317QBN2_9GAMM|nr:MULTISPECIES: SDR family oxidoreductase [Pseudidiomarina]MDT7524770.1 SDR family oxidoreductase [Pseudidiomarina sp. GXY010]PWW14353.1 3-oxoacyl-[acyl-carrier protein] reductase [Pseudidiomarina maritima]RBP92647.1 3-oxoacyl-[acyl-carrier protein] reductase [Pseudidiomarina tainanensis]